MRFFADENLHAELVAWLRSQSHDVVYAAESHQRERDPNLLQLAAHDRRVLITDDKDFGELVFRRHLVTEGVVLLRLLSLEISTRISRLQAVWSVLEVNLPGTFYRRHAEPNSHSATWHLIPQHRKELRS